jgi:hypothetical protein
LIRLSIASFPAAFAAYIIGLPFQPAAAPETPRTYRDRRKPPNRDHVGDNMLRLTPPTSTTLAISMILAAVAVAGQFIQPIASYVPVSMFWLAVIAYVVLFLGNIIRGL